MKIQDITCHKILNSRGDWTIETTVVLDDGSIGEQTVPSGASKGEKEAVDIDAERAVATVTSVIKDALIGEDASEQRVLDEVLLKMDGTENKSNLGGNSILSVSLALAKATAKSLNKELYSYLSLLYTGHYKKSSELKFPTPVFNILNGGKHAQNNLSFQEFMVIPAITTEYDKALHMGVEIYHQLKENLVKDNLATGVGDEGGFAPEGLTPAKAFEYISKSTGKYKLGKDVFLGTDVAAGSFFESDKYIIAEEEKTLTSDELADFYRNLTQKYPIKYLEDPFYENDYSAWEKLNANLPNKTMIVGDDLVVTNTKELKKALDKNLIDAVIVKPNQIGSLSETFDFIKLAQENNLQIIVSHRSGETSEDTFIADLAVAVGAEFIKSGAPVRGERVAKYNRLLDIYLER